MKLLQSNNTLSAALKKVVEFLNLKPKTMFGIDVSHNNGLIDWGLVAQNKTKVDFAIIKTSEGSTVVDERAAFNAKEARNHGIPISYYHFATLNKEDEIPDAKEEARFFMKTISGLPKNNFKLALDIEKKNDKVDIDPQEVLNYINAFFGELAINGYGYMLYSFTPFLDAWLPANHNLSDVDLWLAQFNNRAYPRMPRGWSKYLIWQNTDGGRVSGISTVCDLNKAEGLIFV